MKASIGLRETGFDNRTNVRYTESIKGPVKEGESRENRSEAR